MSLLDRFIKDLSHTISNATGVNRSVAVTDHGVVTSGGARQRLAWIVALFLLIQVLAVAGPVPDAQAVEDTTPPTLVEFSFTPTTVDTSAADRTITFTARITDDLSGLGPGSNSQVRFDGPSGQYVHASFSEFYRISGDALDGVYEYTATVPRYSEQGTWTVFYFSLDDEVGNRQSLTASDLTTLGFPTTFAQTGAGDTTPPTLVEFSFTPTTVDTSAADQTITFTARITDDLSGLGPGSNSQVRFDGPSGQYVHASFSEFYRISGDALDGVYEYTATVPRYSEQGTWTVFYFSLDDEAGNHQWLYTADLVTLGFPTTFAQTGVGDTTPPTLVEFSFTPTTVDTSVADRTITFTARITDDLAGVTGTGYSSSPSQVPFVSPSGQRVVALFYEFYRISGDSLDGVYEYTTTIPQGSEQGTWTASRFYLADQVGNDQRLYTADLVTLGLPTEFTVGPTPPSASARVDFGGDGATDIAVFRSSNGRWYIQGQAGVGWGVSTDIPVPADYDGDGSAEFAVFRPSNGRWYVNGQAGVGWGLGTDIPVPGDYDGDGTTDFAVFRPSNGKWYVHGQAGVGWGQSGDIPVPGDYDGDGTTDFAVFRPSNGRWYVHGQAGVGWGLGSDIPVPGDYDGDGAEEFAVFRPSNGRWYMYNQAGVGWGLGTDIPTPIPPGVLVSALP